MECADQRNVFELIPAVKMETRHPVEESFGNKFSSIYNHYGVMAAFIFCVFFEKNDPLQENFRNFVSKGFIATPIDVLCSNFVKFGRLEISKVVRYLPDKKNKILPGSPALATSRLGPKSARARTRQCT